MLSKLTIASLHNYSKGELWDNLELPEGVDKEIFINEVLRQASEFSVLYPDYDFMKYQIGVWSHKYLHNFERWWSAYNFEYNALYNLDVTRSVVEHGSNQEDSSKDASASSSHQTAGNQTGDNDTTRKKAAYDASTFQNVGFDTADTSLSSSESGSTSEMHSESMTSKSDNWVTTEETRAGNQGITMSQELLLAEYNAWRANVYVMMAELFVSEFCICIYK